MNTVSENLKRIRQEKGLTQQQMADKLFVTQQAVSNWEKGKTMPTVDMLVDIAAELDVDIDELLYDYIQCRERQGKKTKQSAILSGILLIVFAVSFIIGKRRDNLEIYWFARLFVFPVMSFIWFYTVALFLKTKRKSNKDKYKDKYLPLKHFIKGVILIFLFLTVILYIAVMIFKISPRPQMFFDIWHIQVSLPWIYALAGGIYGFVDEKRK